MAEVAIRAALQRLQVWQAQRYGEPRNAAGAVVYQQAFGAQVPLQRITAGSPAQKQFDSVCT